MKMLLETERNDKLYYNKKYITDEKINWNLLRSSHWKSSFLRNIEYVKYCNWSKLKSNDWRWLLQDLPQFAEYCDWDKITDNDWFWLLLKCPQFKKYKKK